MAFDRRGCTRKLLLLFHSEIFSYLIKPDDYKKIQSCDYQRGTEKTHRDQEPIEVMDNCL